MNDLPTVGDVTTSTRGVLVTDQSLESDSASTEICLNSFDRYESISGTDLVNYSKLKEAPNSKDIFESSRMLIRRLVSRSDRLLGTVVSDDFVSKKDVYIFKSDTLSESTLLAILNSQFLSWWQFNVEMSASKDDFRQITLGGLRDLPLPLLMESSYDTPEESDIENPSQLEVNDIEIVIGDEEGLTQEAHDILYKLVQRVLNLTSQAEQYNTNLLYYFGNKIEGDSLENISFYQPESDPDSVLRATKTDYTISASAPLPSIANPPTQS